MKAVLNRDLERLPGWELMPKEIKDAYLTEHLFQDGKIVLELPDNIVFSPEEKRNLFLLGKLRQYYYWHKLIQYLELPWESFPLYWISNSSELVYSDEVFEQIQSNLMPIGFVSPLNETEPIYF